MKPKTRVLVAMSGGVDSSVAAMLMKKKEFDVIGVFMKNYSDSKNEFGECSWKDERKMAMKISSLLGIPLITLDFEKQYKKEVIKKMFQDYRKGITPNPDIDCNQKIKFPLLIKAMKKFGAEYLVTGHYSRIKSVSRGAGGQGDGGGIIEYQLLRARDEMKDQSYFLYRLKQEELRYLKFPIGNFTKNQVREIARKNNFPNYDKKSTVGICFVGKVNLKDFLKKKIKPKKGKILSPEGKTIGGHDGIYYYTIGQRLGSRYGIEVSKNTDDKRFLKRWYVARKDAKTNIIIAAPENNPLLFRKEIFIKNAHWINKGNLRLTPKIRSQMGGRVGKKQNEVKVLARIRQVGELLPCKIIFGKKIKVILKKPITGISEGQAIVLYKGKKILGGGEIRF